MSWERVLNKGQGKVETFQAEERMYKGKTSLKGVSAMHDCTTLKVCVGEYSQ
jgi:hypothetical protein